MEAAVKEVKKIQADRQALQDSLARLEQHKKTIEAQLVGALETLTALRQQQQQQAVAVDATQQQKEEAEEETDFQSLYLAGQENISRLQAMVEDLRTELKASSQGYAEEIKMLKEDIDGIKWVASTHWN